MITLKCSHSIMGINQCQSSKDLTVLKTSKKIKIVPRKIICPQTVIVSKPLKRRDDALKILHLLTEAKYTAKIITTANGRFLVVRKETVVDPSAITFPVQYDEFDTEHTIKIKENVE